MTAEQTSTGRMTRSQMDALVDRHFRAEQAGDLDAIVATFTPDAEHDVVGRTGDPLYGGDQIAGFYRALLAELRIDRFEPVRRWYGDDHVVDESVLHATATGRPFGFDGRGRLGERLQPETGGSIHPRRLISMSRALRTQVHVVRWRGSVVPPGVGSA